jgi:hypothetical protein
MGERDPGPAARFEEFKSALGFAEDVYRQLTGDEPKSLAEISRVLRVPKGEFTRWFQTEHGDLYDAALKSVTDEMIFAAKRLLDDATQERAALVKVRVDGYLKLAAKWDRARYGESVRVERTGALTVDAGLIGEMGALLRLVASGRQERVVNEMPGEASDAAEVPPPAEVAPARLPAVEFLI